MRKYILPALIVAALLIVPRYPVYAQSQGSARQSSNSAALRRNLPPQATESASKAGAIRDRMLEKKETIMENLQSRIAKVSTRAAALKAKLGAFKDKTKADTAQKVSDNLNMINEK